MAIHHYIACDLGAESGRVMLAKLDHQAFSLEEIHRFPTGPIRVLGSLRWNVLDIFNQLKIGLKKVVQLGAAVESLSVDSWGVDYVLLKDNQPMLSPPYHYRDSRTEQSYTEALNTTTSEMIFSETGIQFMTINTLYQLVAEQKQNGDILDVADQFLNIGDYFNYLFSGVCASEISLASTTQLFNPKTKSWSNRLIDEFALPAKIFPKTVDSGTVLGMLLPEVAVETGLTNVRVIATCSHDTGAAIAAVPAQEGDDWAYLSSGTWSVMGVELSQPLINDQVHQSNFTNEIGYGRTTRFLKNIVGLWLLQECRRSWAAAGQEFSYEDLTHLAEEADPFRSLVNPGDSRFLAPDDMPQKIEAYCRETGQPMPQTPGQFVRGILESLALLYRTTIEQIETLTDRQIRWLHVVGGGSQSSLLNQFTANATGKTVLAGPVEATATGNALIQALALGHLTSWPDLRKTVAAAFPLQEIQPDSSSERWTHTYQKFVELTG